MMHAMPASLLTAKLEQIKQGEAAGSKAGHAGALGMVRCPLRSDELAVLQELIKRCDARHRDPPLLRVERILALGCRREVLGALDAFAIRRLRDKALVAELCDPELALGVGISPQEGEQLVAGADVHRQLVSGRAVAVEDLRRAGVHLAEKRNQRLPELGDRLLRIGLRIGVLLGDLEVGLELVVVAGWPRLHDGERAGAVRALPNEGLSLIAVVAEKLLCLVPGDVLWVGVRDERLFGLRLELLLVLHHAAWQDRQEVRRLF